MDTNASRCIQHFTDERKQSVISPSSERSESSQSRASNYYRFGPGDPGSQDANPVLSLSIDMEISADGQRGRTNSMLSGGLSGDDTAQGRKPQRRRQRRRSQDCSHEEEDYKHFSPSSDDSHISELLSRPLHGDHKLGDTIPDDGLTDDEEAGLTGKDRRKRKQRRRRNTLLNERVVGIAKGTGEEKLVADKSVLMKSLINALLIGLWYLFSVSISMYNTWMFGKSHLDFHFPLFTTCMHMLVQFCLASAVLYFFPRFRPRADSISNPQGHPILAQQDPSQLKKPLMTRLFYITRIGPCGAATGLDIGLGNMSLKFITLTFFTMCKSSALAFVLLFAFVFHLETPSIKLILVIFTMTVGVIMMVAGETDFNALGFVLIISSAFFSGFRWALTQILLLRNPATSNPFSSIFFLAPIMFLSLAILAISVEGFSALKLGLDHLAQEKGVFLSFALIMFPGVLAFCMTTSEFALLQRTSVVTLSICGIFKEVVTISAANMFFHDTLTPINISGLLVTIASIAAYNYMKITKMRSEARKRVEDRGREGMEPMLGVRERRGRRASAEYEGEGMSNLYVADHEGEEVYGGEGSTRISHVKEAEGIK